MFYKIIPRFRIDINTKEIFNIPLLLFKGQLIKGECLDNFEKKFSAYIRTRFSLAIGSGRLGLRLILETLGIEKGEEIIIPAYTFYAVPEVIEKSGFKNVFVDVNDSDYNINVSLIESKITKKTKAIIATHLFGTPCELNKILEIARKYNLFVIEDCAQAIGAEYHGKKVGSFGDCAFFSFETVKPFHTFGGGMITTNNQLLYEKLKRKIERIPYPKYKGITKKIIFSIAECLLTHPFFFTMLMYPLLLTASCLNKDLKSVFRKTKKKFKMLQTRYANFQACVGLIKLEELEAQLNKRIANANALASELKYNIYSQKNDPLVRKIFYRLALKSNDVRMMTKILLKNGIDVDTNVTQNCVNSGSVEEYPVAVEVNNSILLLPVYPQLNLKDIKRIARILNQNF